MAIKSDGTVYINTKLDTSGVNRKITSLGKTFLKLGAIITATFAVSKLISFGKQAVELGSNMEEVQNVVDTAFGSMRGEMEAFAETSLETYGLSKLAAKQMASTYMSMAKGMGQATEIASDYALEMTGRLGDIMSFWNKTADEVNTIGRAVYSGESEPLKAIGVIMNETTLQAYALSKGYKTLYKDMAQSEKLLIRQRFFLENTSLAAGDFLKTQGSWANQTRILSESFKEFQSNIGQGLINIFTPLLQMLNSIVAKMVEFSNSFKVFTEIITGKGANAPPAAIESLTGEYDDLSNSIQGAENAQKGMLASFDKINVIGKKDASGSSVVNTSDVMSGNEALGTTESIADRLAEKFQEIYDLIKDGAWKEIGLIISNGISEGISKLSKLIEEIDWYSIGMSIGAFLSGLDWYSILKATGNFVAKMFDAGFELWKGSFDANPIGTIILTAFALLKFTGLGTLIMNGIILGLKNIGAKIVETIVLSLGGAGSLSEVVAAVFGVSLTAIGGVISALSGAILAAISFVNMMIDGFDWLKEILMIIGIALAAVGAVLLGVEAAVAAIVAAVVAAVATVVILIKDNWDTIKGFFLNIAGWLNDNVISPVASFFSGLFKRIGQYAEGGWLILQAVWSIASEWFSETVIEPVAGLFSNLWESIKKAASWFSEKVIDPIVENFTIVTEYLGGIFEKLWDSISGGVKNAFNAVISFIETAINGIIDGINKIIEKFNSVGKWAGNVVGKDYGGIDAIPNVKIPKLATGAVIPPNAPFMAMLGDQKNGVNIEAPLDTIKQGLYEVMSNFKAKEGDIIIQIDGREVFRAVRRENDDYIRRNGSSAFQY